MMKHKLWALGCAGHTARSTAQGQPDYSHLGLTCEHVLLCENQPPDVDIFHPDLIASCLKRSEAAAEAAGQFSDDPFLKIAAYPEFVPEENKQCHRTPETTRFQAQSTSGMQRKDKGRQMLLCTDHVLPYGHAFSDAAYCTCVNVFKVDPTPERCKAEKREATKKQKKVLIDRGNRNHPATKRSKRGRSIRAS